MSISLDEQQKLIKELKSGSSTAFTFLFKTYYKLLYAYCISLTKDKNISDDIVQNTFLKIWNNKHKLQIHTSLKSYLYKSVYNSFIDVQSKNKKTDRISDIILINTLSNTIKQDDAILKEKIILLDKAIDDLPTKCKKVFLLNKKEGYTYQEIANILNISEKTVENHMGNALKKIRKYILLKKNHLIFYISTFKSYFKKINKA